MLEKDLSWDDQAGRYRPVLSNAARRFECKAKKADTCPLAPFSSSTFWVLANEYRLKDGELLA